MPIILENKHEPVVASQVPQEPEPLLTVREVAELLRVPVSWVYERTRRHGRERLPHLKVGKYLRFRRADVLGWLNACRI
jgi:excisionase family DNA binding protein